MNIASLDWSNIGFRGGYIADWLTPVAIVRHRAILFMKSVFLAAMILLD